jgi:chromosome segregation ATPase
MDLNIDRELEAIQHELDQEPDSALEQARHLDAQIAEQTTAITRLLNALPDLEDRATGELAAAEPAAHSAALRAARSEVHDREENLTLLRGARLKVERRVAEQQALRASRVEDRLRPLFVEATTEIEGVMRRAEALNEVLEKLHQFSQRHLGPVHGLSQGYSFPSLGHWHERVKTFVREPKTGRDVGTSEARET